MLNKAVTEEDIHQFFSIQLTGGQAAERMKY